MSRLVVCLINYRERVVLVLAADSSDTQAGRSDYWLVLFGLFGWFVRMPGLFVRVDFDWR